MTSRSKTLLELFKASVDEAERWSRKRALSDDLREIRGIVDRVSAEVESGGIVEVA